MTSHSPFNILVVYIHPGKITTFNTRSTAYKQTPGNTTVECVRLDDSEANGVHCSSVNISDRKLTMRPVVILEDIIEKIMWGCYIAPPSGSVSNTAPHIGTDE